MKAAIAPFDLVDGDSPLGVVLVHGFTGSPYEVRYLGDQLAGAGFAVRGVLLPGHGTSLDDLDRTTWKDWAEHVERAVDAMRLRYRQVAIVGQSLGGLLALHVAAHRHDVACVASLAAPLWLEGLSGRVASLARAGKMPVRTVPKFGGSDVRDKRAKADNPCYPAIPMRALGELMAFMEVVQGDLSRVTQPLLVLHARQDHTAPASCAAAIIEGARAARVKRLRILPRSYHLIAIDVEREIVAAEVATFVRAHTTSKEISCAT